MKKIWVWIIICFAILGTTTVGQEMPINSNDASLKPNLNSTEIFAVSNISNISINENNSMREPEINSSPPLSVETPVFSVVADIAINGSDAVWKPSLLPANVPEQNSASFDIVLSGHDSLLKTILQMAGIQTQPIPLVSIFLSGYSSYKLSFLANVNISTKKVQLTGIFVSNSESSSREMKIPRQFSGIVEGIDRRPLNSTVNLFDAKDLHDFLNGENVTPAQSAVTDVNGSYIITNIRPGKYFIQAKANSEDYRQAFEQQVNVLFFYNRELNFTLKRVTDKDRKLPDMIDASMLDIYKSLSGSIYKNTEAFADVYSRTYRDFRFGLDDIPFSILDYMVKTLECVRDTGKSCVVEELRIIEGDKR